MVSIGEWDRRLGGGNKVGGKSVVSFRVQYKKNSAGKVAPCAKLYGFQEPYRNPTGSIIEIASFTSPFNVSDTKGVLHPRVGYMAFTRSY